jgi:predicted ATPase
MNPFVSRVTIRNYKSIAACRVDLRDLMFLVGPNGSGKSNFLDALRFVADALRSSLDHALRDRGTIKEVRRRSGGHPNHFAIRLNVNLPSGQIGHYAFRVGAKPAGAYEVQSEECRIYASGDVSAQSHYFHVQSGTVKDASFSIAPASLPDRLFLVAVSGIPEFRPIFDALSRIEVYNLNPREIAAMQKPDPGDILRRDGSNAASVLQQFSLEARALVDNNLARIVQGVAGAEAKTLGSQETIEFRQVVKGQAHPWHFLAGAMSDGTLRAFGILLAVFQAASARSGRSPLLIGLEEPEMALHPAAAGVLLSALREGARYCQILVTSHSPDLLDNSDIPIEALLAVSNQDGLTQIGPIDSAGRDVLREKLFTPGELLRQNQLAPDKNAINDVAHERQLGLFDINGR